MANRVEIAFAIDDDTAARRALKEIDTGLDKVGQTSQAISAAVDAPFKAIADSGKLAVAETKTISDALERLQRTAKAAGVEIDKAQSDSLRSLGLNAINQTTAGLEKQLATQKAVTTETLRTAQAAKEVETAVRKIPAQPLKAADIAASSSLTSRAAGFAAPNVAAASAVERATQGFDKASEGSKRLSGNIVQLTQSFKNLEGVSFAEGANTLTSLLGGSATGALAITGIAAIGAVAVSVSQQIREQTEADLKRIQAQANLGLTGGLEKRGTEQERLEKTLQAAKEARLVGQDPNQLIRAQLATEVLENSIKKALREAAQIPTSLFAGEGASKGLFGDPDKLFVGIQNQKELELQINSILKQRTEIEDRLGITQQKRLDKAREERNIQESIVDHINQTFGAFQKESEEAEKVRDRLRETSQLAVDNLSRQLETNPFVKAYDAATLRADEFRKQSGEVSAQFVADFEAANAQILNLELFKTGLASKDRLNSLLAEFDKGASPDVRQARARDEQSRLGNFVGGQSDSETEIRRLRGQTIDEVDALRRKVAELNATPGLNGRFLQEAIATATQGASLEVLDRANLRGARANALQELSDAQRRDFQRQSLEARNADRTFDSIQGERGKLDQFSGAARNTAEAALLERLIGIDPAKLRPEQQDVRQAAIERSIELQTQLAEDQAKRDEAKLATEEKLTEATSLLHEAITKLFTKESLIQITVDPDLNSRTSFLPSNNQ